MAWNGTDELEADDVLHLNPPDAARWWAETVAGGDASLAHVKDDAEEHAVARAAAAAFNLPGRTWQRALEYAARCYRNRGGGHAHTCLDCDVVLERGDFDCEFDADHDFAFCDRCAADAGENREGGTDETD